MHWLPTVLSTGAALIAVLCALAAQRTLSRMDRELKRTASLRARVLALEGCAETITAQHRKLAGKYYQEMADVQARLDELPDDGEPMFGRDDGTVGPRAAEWPSVVCANWAEAQIEGPLSTFAQCECGYCSAMRAERERVKRELVPKGNSARVDSMKRGIES